MMGKKLPEILPLFFDDRNCFICNIVSEADADRVQCRLMSWRTWVRDLAVTDALFPLAMHLLSLPLTTKSTRFLLQLMLGCYDNG